MDRASIICARNQHTKRGYYMITNRAHWDTHPDGRPRVWVWDRWWLETVASPKGEPPIGFHPDDIVKKKPYNKEAFSDDVIN